MITQDRFLALAGLMLGKVSMPYNRERLEAGLVAFFNAGNHGYSPCSTPSIPSHRPSFQIFWNTGITRPSPAPWTG